VSVYVDLHLQLVVLFFFYYYTLLTSKSFGSLWIKEKLTMGTIYDEKVDYKNNLWE